jgi:hypothetical protein
MGTSRKSMIARKLMRLSLQSDFWQFTKKIASFICFIRIVFDFPFHMRRHDANILMLIPNVQRKELRFNMNPNQKIMGAQHDEAEKLPGTPSTTSVQ